jgi:hypothetical protein
MLRPNVDRPIDPFPHIESRSKSEVIVIRFGAVVGCHCGNPRVPQGTFELKAWFAASIIAPKGNVFSGSATLTD